MNTQINMQEHEARLLADEELEAVAGGSQNLTFLQSAIDQVIKTLGESLGTVARKG
jgi:hypothetical protein